MVPRDAEQKRYIKALEERVAELEKNLSYSGRSGVADDHLEPIRPREIAVDSLSIAIRDLTLNASGYSYIGGSSSITLGRLLEPVLHSNKQSMDDVVDDYNRDPLVTRIFPQVVDEPLPDTSSFSDPIAETVFLAYIDNISPFFPLLHSRKLQDIHLKRNKLNSIFEICVLHLVYAIGGRTLELV